MFSSAAHRFHYTSYKQPRHINNNSINKNNNINNKNRNRNNHNNYNNNYKNRVVIVNNNNNPSSSSNTNNVKINSKANPLVVYVPPHPLIKHYLNMARNEMTPQYVFKAAINV